MNICIFGAASDDIDQIYFDETYRLAKKLAEAGNKLVFGAGSTGVMGSAAKGFAAGGGEIIGIIPKFLVDEEIEPLSDKCTRVIVTSTMNERKNKMEDMSDVFLVFPGGSGTYEEFFEVFTLKRLGQTDKKIVIYNVNHYFDPLLALLKHTEEKGFMLHEWNEMYLATDNPDAVIEYIK